MALDAQVATDTVPGGKIAVDFTPDISAAATQSSTHVALGKGGLPQDSWFVVDQTTLGDADGDAGDMVLYLELSTDNGAHYYKVAEVTFLAGELAIAGKRRACPIGLIDVVPERLATATIAVRVTATWTQDADGTDNPVFQCYLAGPQHARQAPYV